MFTTSTWMREFVTSHPAYKQDSVVNDEIQYDLLKRCQEITRGQGEVPAKLLGRFWQKQPLTAQAGNAWGKERKRE